MAIKLRANRACTHAGKPFAAGEDLVVERAEAQMLLGTLCFTLVNADVDEPEGEPEKNAKKPAKRGKKAKK